MNKATPSNTPSNDDTPRAFERGGEGTRDWTNDNPWNRRGAEPRQESGREGPFRRLNRGAERPSSPMAFGRRQDLDDPMPNLGWDAPAEPSGRGAAATEKHSWWQPESPTVAEIMTKQVKHVAPEAGAREVAQLMKQEDIGVVPVVQDDGRLLGLVTDRDIVIRGLAEDRPIEDCRAKDLCTRDLEVASPSDSLEEVVELMGRQQIRRVPVLDHADRLVGIISLSDIANRADHHDNLQRTFARISGKRSFWSRIWR